jgi:GNAT superfamily N-acetyltransferase
VRSRVAPVATARTGRQHRRHDHHHPHPAAAACRRLDPGQRGRGVALPAHRRALLDQRSDELAASLLDPLDNVQRTELVAAMRSVERLITRAFIRLRQVDAASLDAQRCLRAYTAELNRRAPERGFDPSSGATAEPHEVRPPKGAFVVAYLRGEAVGCGAIKHHAGEVSDIKRMWVAESVRGLGLGRSLLEHLERLAREHGSTEVHMETSDVLPEAIALYRSAGYAQVPPFNDEPFADRWFAKAL